MVDLDWTSWSLGLDRYSFPEVLPQAVMPSEFREDEVSGVVDDVAPNLGEDESVVVGGISAEDGASLEASDDVLLVAAGS